MSKGKSPSKNILVTCCRSDLYNPMVYALCLTLGVMNEERFVLTELSTFEYTHEELSTLLENLFGFSKGGYKTTTVEEYHSRFKGIVHNELVYVGYERTDKSWKSSSLASDAVKQLK